MRPDELIGFDPTPGDAATLVSASDLLSRVVTALADARGEIDGLGRTGSMWDGSRGAPIAGLLRGYSRQLSMLEESLRDCSHALDLWRVGLDHRQSQVSGIVAEAAGLAGDPTAQDRRTRLIAAAREIGAEHDRAAKVFAAAFEDLSALVAELGDQTDNLALDLDHVLRALATAVEV